MRNASQGSTAPTPPLRIGGLAARANVSTDTLRFYERLGLLPPPARTPSGYRLYDEAAVDRLAFIAKGQALGLTLDEVREILRLTDRGTPPCDHVRQTLAARLADIDSRLAELQSLRVTLNRTLTRSQRLRLAKSCFCGIIESSSPNQERP